MSTAVYIHDWWIIAFKVLYIDLVFRNTGVVLGHNYRVGEWQGPGDKRKTKDSSFHEPNSVRSGECVLIRCVGSKEEGEHMWDGHGEVLGTDWWHQLSLREKTKPDSWSPVTATSAENAALDSYWVWVGGSITDIRHTHTHTHSFMSP